eukprot:Blabericola_migrator_1__13408@NODE_959_length_5893_cov_215_544113_g665_i0_p4_GENE_NODE_959_length_5893_cov_215_544113_g665_i0NODE_959_length_5893_cov_215_544113_g665_i0_p4_ORF_typecomplete_len133_score5_81_NODE_959_length_5893_cov_215_544113_g665_i040444442
MESTPSAVPPNCTPELSRRSEASECSHPCCSLESDNFCESIASMLSGEMYDDELFYRWTCVRALKGFTRRPEPAPQEFEPHPLRQTQCVEVCPLPLPAPWEIEPHPLPYLEDVRCVDGPRRHTRCISLPLEI